MERSGQANLRLGNSRIGKWNPAGTISWNLGEAKPRSVRSRVLLVIINLIAVVSLIWTFHDAHLSELLDDLKTLDWPWMTLAVTSAVGVFLWQALRWLLILRPVAPIGFWETARALYVGLFANEVLPLRAGELIRCYLIARRPELPLSVSLTSVLIERVFDGIWLCLALALVLAYIPLTGSLRFLVDGAYVLAGLVIVLAIILGLAMFRRHKARAIFSGGGWHRQLRILVDDLEAIGHSHFLLQAFLQSLPLLLLQTVPVFASIRGYGFDLSLGTAFALMVIIRTGSAIPQAPGNLGIFQFLAKETLQRVFSVAPDEAARFSLVLWGVVTIPLVISGLFALWVTDVKLGELHLAARHAKRAHTARRAV
jgi:uncharacterized membrane protein YbhN (UPF0104 family)